MSGIASYSVQKAKAKFKDLDSLNISTGKGMGMKCSTEMRNLIIIHVSCDKAFPELDVKPA